MSRRLPRRSKRRRPDMFLSHSSVDEVFARRLVEHLDSLGIDVWLAEWDFGWTYGEQWHMTPTPDVATRVVERLGFPQPGFDELHARDATKGVYESYLPTGFYLRGRVPRIKWEEVVRMDDWRTRPDRGPPHADDVAGTWEHLTGDDPPVSYDLRLDGSVVGLPFQAARWGSHEDRLCVLVQGEARRRRDTSGHKDRRERAACRR